MSDAAPAPQRMAPHHCPYCGDEDLRPVEGGSHAEGAGWECRSCARSFALKFIGLTRRGAS